MLLVVPPGGIKCSFIISLDALPHPLPLGTTFVNGGKAVCRQSTFFLLIFSHLP